MRFLILHGWQGSGPEHWQTWLAGRLRAAGHHVQYPELPACDEPWLRWVELGRRRMVIPGSHKGPVVDQYNDKGEWVAPRGEWLLPPKK